MAPTNDHSPPTWAADLIRAVQLPQQLQLIEPGQILVAAVPDGASLQELRFDDDSARYAAGMQPLRPTGNPLFLDGESFIAYLNKHKQDTHTELYADLSAGKVQAVIDWHAGASQPCWGVHRPILKFNPDPSWKRWNAVDRKLFSQQEFAEFLEDQRDDIVKPSAAEVMEACANLDITTTASFTSRVRLDNGTTQFVYSEDQRTGALQVPTQITLKVSPYDRLPPYAVTARIRTALREQKLTFKVILDRPDLVECAAIEEVCSTIATKTGCAMFYGTPSQPLI